MDSVAKYRQLHSAVVGLYYTLFSVSLNSKYIFFASMQLNGNDYQNCCDSTDTRYNERASCIFLFVHISGPSY